MADMATPNPAPSSAALAAFDAAQALSQSAGDRMKAADKAVAITKSVLASAVKEAARSRVEATAANVLLDAASVVINGKASVPWYLYAAGAVVIVALIAIPAIHYLF